jgi:Family of unknown function (DUF6326)
MERIGTRLSMLWLFATLNYLYCDVVTLMDPTVLHGFLSGKVGGMTISQGFLLAGGVLVEVPMAMVLLARVLPPRANRWTNVGAAAFMTVVQAATLLTQAPAAYYVFFSTFEIATTVAITWIAWRGYAASALAARFLSSVPNSLET